MATCPRCGTALKDEYGMSQCPGCGAFCFVDMEGNAVVQQDEPAPSNFPESMENVIDVDPNENPIASEPAVEQPGADWQNVGSFDSSEPEATPPPQDFASNDFKPFDPLETSDNFEPIDMSPSSGNENDPAPTNSGFHAGPKPIAAEPSFGPADDPLNLNGFANSEVSAAKDGPLLFRVLISGIDTREIRESIREVLEDPRFAWDSNEIFSKVSKGHLAINGLSPVKASILITRIKRLPVEIRWEQYAIAQGQP